MIEKNIEILAPVADEMMLRAAVHSGAGAIYLGMPGFNARGRTPDFDDETLKKYIEYCHLYGLKVYVAFNILLFEEELKGIVEPLYRLLSLAPDAIIVQDIGLARLIKHICPEQEIHASTQMTISSAEAIKATSDLDIKRYILARELSVSEIAAIRKETDKELEVFIHGALCVSYSGQCLTSESIGGRSANRGQCAQSCRFEYDLIVDGKKKDLGSRKYLLSPFDLSAKDEIRALVASGINCFKIEGRYKSPEYVAANVRFYHGIIEGGAVDRKAFQDLGVLYSRGFYSGWLKGVNHQKFINAEYCNHHGLRIGNVKGIGKQTILVDIDYEIVAGDGVLFREDSTDIEVGGYIYEVKKVDGGTELGFARTFDIQAVKKGMTIFVNSSPSVDKANKRYYVDKAYFKRVPIDCELSGGVDSRLKCVYRDDDGNEIQEESVALLEKASKVPLAADYAVGEVGALSNTPFELRKFEFNVDSGVFIHQREIKRLRQKSIETLVKKREARPEKLVVPEDEAFHFISPPGKEGIRPEKPALHVLVRKQDQLGGLANLNIDTVYLDFEYGSIYSEAVKTVRDFGFKVGIATTRIFKPGENKTLDSIVSVLPDVILARNFGAFEYLRNICRIPLVADFSFNVANSLAARWLFDQGFLRICPSYDLNQKQLRALIGNAECGKFEITVHQYIPAFHMDYCVFASYLSSGSSYKDCGRPCEKYRIELQDRKGVKHPVHADLECRNTMFNGNAQSAARLIPELVKDGVVSFRIEALYETSDELREKIMAYQSMIFDGQSFSKAFDQLKVVEQYGLGEGQLLNDRIYNDRKRN